MDIHVQYRPTVFYNVNSVEVYKSYFRFSSKGLTAFCQLIRQSCVLAVTLVMSFSKTSHWSGGRTFLPGDLDLEHNLDLTRLAVQRILPWRCTPVRS